LNSFGGVRGWQATLHKCMLQISNVWTHIDPPESIQLLRILDDFVSEVVLPLDINIAVLQSFTEMVIPDLIISPQVIQCITVDIFESVKTFRPEDLPMERLVQVFEDFISDVFYRCVTVSDIYNRVVSNIIEHIFRQDGPSVKRYHPTLRYIISSELESEPNSTSQQSAALLTIDQCLKTHDNVSYVTVLLCDIIEMTLETESIEEDYDAFVEAVSTLRMFDQFHLSLNLVCVISRVKSYIAQYVSLLIKDEISEDVRQRIDRLLEATSSAIFSASIYLVKLICQSTTLDNAKNLLQDAEWFKQIEENDERKKTTSLGFEPMSYMPNVRGLIQAIDNAQVMGHHQALATQIQTLLASPTEDRNLQLQYSSSFTSARPPPCYRTS